MKPRSFLPVLASGILLSSPVAATTLTTPLLGIGTADYYHACYVLNAGKKTLQPSIQIIDTDDTVRGADEVTLPPGDVILVSSGQPTPGTAYCKVEFEGPKQALRVTLCRATTVNNVAECGSAVVTAP